MSNSVPSNCENIFLDSLKSEHTVITSESSGYFVEAAMFCLDNQSHSSGVTMNVKTDESQTCCNIHWEGEITEKIKRLFRGNKNKTTEIAATTVALLLIPIFTEFTSIEEAPIGSTVDYFLSSNQPDDTYIFNNIEAYCEIRGIREEKKGNTVQGAIRKKVNRLKKIEDLPTYIVIVEFSKPFSRVTSR